MNKLHISQCALFKKRRIKGHKGNCRNKFESGSQYDNKTNICVVLVTKKFII